jgi:hypothetical protein
MTGDGFMKTFVPYEKLSKKEQKKINAQKRKDWNGVVPVTRKVENKKVYNRKKNSLPDYSW